MVCSGCGRLTFFKYFCKDCERNERMFQSLPIGDRTRLHIDPKASFLKVVDHLLQRTNVNQ
jgi:hypothetical protein